MEPVNPERLSLYITRYCPFCIYVVRSIKQLGVDIELRDINKDSAARADLIKARNRQTVPVLRISNEGEPDTWMPESADIVRWLNAQYAANP